MMKARSIAATSLGVIFLLMVIALFVGSKIIYRLGTSEMAAPYSVSPAAKQLHDSLIVADLHADTAAHRKDFSKPQPYGHIGSDRLAAGNLSFLTLAIPTEATIIPTMQIGKPRGLNAMAMGSIFNGHPFKTWTSNFQRGLYTLDFAKRIVSENSERMFLITHREDIDRLRKAHIDRPAHPSGVLLAVEGIHILDADLGNLQPLIDMGIRMISLTHAFDNEAAGSNTGTSQYGMTDYGREALQIMQANGIVLDLAHASQKTIDEALEIVDNPVIFSHTGIRATCDMNRNITDQTIRKVGENGGVIGIGFFTYALCGTDVDAIVSAMQHIKDMIGAEHIALGSDYDGGVNVVFDVSGLPVLTDALLKNGFTPKEIRLIMGENVLRVFSQVLPMRAEGTKPD